MERLAIGFIRTSHGLKGTLKVRCFSEEKKHLFRIKQLYIKKEDHFLARRVEKVGRSAGDLLFDLEGIDTREQALDFRGLEVYVDREDAAPLRKGEYYHADICRCEVYQGEEIIGRVKAVCTGGKTDLLEVADGAGKTVLIPFADPFVDRVDIEGEKIFLDAGFELP
jgi:16S rRNA processing protein RimM